MLILNSNSYLYLNSRVMRSRGRGRYKRYWMQNRRMWHNRVNNKGGIRIHDWNPLNDPTNKYKSHYLSTGQFINKNESISSKDGTRIMKLGEDGILRIFKATSKCSSNPKMGNQSGNAVYMLDKTLYDIQSNKHNNTSTLENGVFFNNTAGECLEKCNNNNECKAVEYYTKNNYSKCQLKSDITKDIQLHLKNVIIVILI